jgi:predicted alpha-1,6-mannanase (GH76 family)
MTLISCLLTFVLVLVGVSSAFSQSQVHTQKVLVSSQSDLQSNAVLATHALLGWYNQTSGLWETTSWWNAANCITTLATVTRLSPNLDYVTRRIWNNTFENAQKYNLFLERFTPDAARLSGISNSSAPGQREPMIRSFNNRNTYHKRPVRSMEKRVMRKELVKNPEGFLNGFYDDEGWWALAWLDVYDVTKEKAHLTAAVDIFTDMVSTGYNATCGGIWWNKKRDYNSAIANELFLQVAARLANRVENKQYYLDWAKKQWAWFEKSGLINEEWNVNDGLDMKTCKNNKGIPWSYNQGVILGGLAELAKADRNNTFNYLTPAKKIASAAIRKLADKDGILHDAREPDLGNDGNQFKGVFARNLRELYDATREPWMKHFLVRNAESVWSKARDPKTHRMGPVWSGPYYPATAATHSSALDVLIAAAAVS